MGAWEGLGAPFAFRGVSLFPISLKTFPFDLCFASGFGKCFIEKFVPIGIVGEGGATCGSAVCVPGR